MLNVVYFGFASIMKYELLQEIAQKSFLKFLLATRVSNKWPIRPRVNLLAMRLQAKYPFFDSQSDVEFFISYAIL